MKKYLLDTNILSELLKPSPNQNIIKKMALYGKQSVTASVVIQEIVFGYQRLPISKRRSEIERYVKELLIFMPVLPYMLENAIWHGEEKARLAKQGKTPAFVDGQIAAIAKTNHLILVTRNISDFQYFSEINIENWFEDN